ncbi:putative hemolysin [Parabacteroides sp. PF5-5]|uniref:1-acyl-sn-glycerol-3-phosphate acyltransferase n=1 Tax=unclassified Parabacteroides TaxID=2649774 RepID=UPI002474083F|nr:MULTISPECIES: 1-acyl-sn-glycerol-3-phosphate acyltransferase [unclassified Parabacteroides]MDH6306461.1 putative hemolysin [Parabacteroides sp. PH5-39]MDH6317387.1 putative hemolysin [Parabacteroides sp. PF5-13]MDH6321172.1 putative hemolysin [Parabacteroides sp. PH5-13]MDH6324904.1 putative hemolysin [Parabacteroides sp. PH5-8]MDH6328572.1 putative hemolysin [Parabacteroides sp. PH5-41]
MAKEELIKYVDLRKVFQEKAPSLYKKLPGFLINYLIRIIHQDEVNYILNHYHDKDGVDFMVELMDYFDLTLRTTGEENLPENGRYIFAANHPLGGLDGICLSALLGQKYDKKVRYLVNDILLFLPNLRSIFIPVNKHGKQAKETAVLTDEAYASDKQIITFPAGLCSRKRKGVITDLEWKKSFVQKAVEYQRDVVPVYFEGRNSNFFYGLSNLRTALGIKANIEMLYLSDELFKSKHSTYHIYYGKPIPWQTFDQTKKPAEWAKWVRDIVYGLKN